MVRPRKKDLADQQAAGVDSTVMDPGVTPEVPEGQTLQEAMTNQPGLPATPATDVQSREITKSDGQEVEKEPYPDPRGSFNIALGDGRRLRLLRSNHFQNKGISFYSNDESIDPKPSVEETGWLKEHGFERYRPEGKMRTMQLLTPDQKADIAELEEDKGKQAATFLRSRLRSETDLYAEKLFVEFANDIRAKNGLEPISYTAAERGAPF